jgi:hypothetical protein
VCVCKCKCVCVCELSLCVGWCDHALKCVDRDGDLTGAAAVDERIFTLLELPLPTTWAANVLAAQQAAASADTAGSDDATYQDLVKTFHY